MVSNKNISNNNIVMKSKKCIIERKWLGMVVICLLSIIPLFFIAIYSRPSADDYGYSKHIIGMINSGDYNVFSLLVEAIKVDIYMWKNSDGPFLSQIIMTLQPGIFGEHLYGIGAISLMIFMGVILLFVFRNICKLFYISCEYSVYFAVIVLALILNNLPGINEGVYWFDGAWNYTPFLFLIILNVSIILKRMKCDENGVIGVCALALISSGGNFIVTYANVLITFTVAIFAFAQKKRNYMFPFAFSFLGFCIEFFSPGTNSRVGDNFSTKGILHAVLMSIKGAYAYISLWMRIEWILLMIFICVAIIILVREEKIDIRKYKCAINPAWYAIYTVIFMVVLLCLPYYATGEAPAPRILNVVWLMFIVMSGISVAYGFMWLMVRWLDRFANADSVVPEINNKSSNWWGVSAFAMSMLAILCVLGICIHNDSNTIIASREIADGTASRYASECDERYERMRNTFLGDELETEPLTYSEIVYFADLSENPEDWQNKSWKEYYGVGMHVVR